MAKQNGSLQTAHYRHLEVLKKDDLSAVYIAEDMKSGETVILKTLRTDALPDPTIITRFKRESSLLSSMKHPGVITALDSGSDGSLLYISFEYFKSRNLRQLMQQGVLTEEVKILLVKQFFASLQYAHSLGIIHRDLKPENILVAENHHLKLGDFGLATGGAENFVTSQYSVVGTPGYMSPEQIQGQTLTLRSDLFSAGIVVFELFTGRNPFVGSDINETLNNIMNYDESQFENEFETLPEEIRVIVRAVLKKNAEKREEGVFALAAALPGDISNFNGTNAGRSSKAYLYTSAALLFAAAIYIISILLPGGSGGNLTGSETFMNAPPEEQQITGNDTRPDSGEQKNAAQEEQKTGDEPKQESESVLIPSQTPPMIPAEDKKESEQTYGELAVEVLPWAVVYIDSVRFETTPLKENIILETGRHYIMLTNPGYPVYRGEVNIREGEVNRLKVNLESLMGYLDCRVHPWGEVYVNGVMKGETPLKSPVKLPPGEYKVVIKNREYGESEFTVKILQGETFTLKHNFKNTN
ncbi:MAG: serine/threonine protein kinase [Ignavibacteriales bacterium]|nr:MAG: serine/threonine protein kinase [Ignavibacteriales bacterium]